MGLLCTVLCPKSNSTEGKDSSFSWAGNFWRPNGLFPFYSLHYKKKGYQMCLVLHQVRHLLFYFTGDELPAQRATGAGLS